MSNLRGGHPRDTGTANRIKQIDMWLLTEADDLFHEWLNDQSSEKITEIIPNLRREIEICYSLGKDPKDYENRFQSAVLVLERRALSDMLDMVDPTKGGDPSDRGVVIA